ncbi:MAG: DUF2339 domain-containing protein [Lysinibacillus sp.]
MDERQLQARIKNVEEAITTLQAVLRDLKKQQVDNNKPQITSAALHQQVTEKKALHVAPSVPEKPQQSIPSNKKQLQNKQEEKFDIFAFCQIWLPRIFVGILLLGVVWLFKAGMDNGLLQPPIRIAFGVLLSIGLVVFGEKQMKANHHALGLVLLGGSIASIVVTTFAAHYLYHYMTSAFAFILNILWILLGIYFANRHKSEYLAIFVSISAFFVPFLIQSAEPNAIVFVGYILLLVMSLLYFAGKNLFPYLYFVTYAVAQLVLLIFTILSPFTSLSIELCILYAVWQIGLYVHVLKDTQFIYKQRLSLFTVNGSLLLFNLFSLDHFSITCLLLSAIVYVIITFAAAKKDSQSLLSSVAFGLAAFTLAVVIMDVFNSSIISVLLLFQGVLSLYVAYVLKNQYKAAIGLTIYSLGALLTMTTPIYYVFTIEALSQVILIVTMFAIIYKGKAIIYAVTPNGYRVSVYVFLVVLFFSLTKLAGALSDYGDINSLVISFVWMIYASCLIWYGRNKVIQQIFTRYELTYIGLFVLCITVGKLFLFDLQLVSLTVRAFLFLIIGGIGVGISRMFFMKNK